MRIIMGNVKRSVKIKIEEHRVFLSSSPLSLKSEKKETQRHGGAQRMTLSSSILSLIFERLGVLFFCKAKK
jgi:hypothetical protein